MKTTILCVLASSLSFAACNPCSTPTVPASTVIVTNESGGAVDGVVLTAQRGDSTVTFNCGGSGDVPADGAANSDASADGSSAAPEPSDGSSGAPIAGTRCTFAGGLGEAPITLRAQAPGFLPLERVVTMSELSMPTGCGFALNLSIALRRQ